MKLIGEAKEITVNADGKRVCEVFIVADTVPSPLPVDGTNVDGMDAVQVFAPMSVLYVPGAGKYVANESGVFVQETVDALLSTIAQNQILVPAREPATAACYVYLLTTAAPDDWAANSGAYYTLSDGVYTAVTGSPAWAADTYYSRRDGLSLTCELEANAEYLPTGALDEVTLTLGATTEANPMYYIKFLTGADGASVSLPESCEYVGGTPPFSASAWYELAAVKMGDDYAVRWCTI